MKWWMVFILMTLLVTQPLWAVELQWKTDKGYRIFKCTSGSTGGVARVKQVKSNGYLVFGGAYQGVVVPAANFVEAARKACGE